MVVHTYYSLYQISTVAFKDSKDSPAKSSPVKSSPAKSSPAKSDKTKKQDEEMI